MSFLSIASWLQKESTNCAELQEKAKKLEELIETQERLQKEKQDNWEENFRLRMEDFQAELHVDELAEESEEQQAAAEEDRRIAEELTQFRAAFRMLDMNQLLAKEEQAAQLQFMQQVQEMHEEYERERPMYEQMEQRQIVQELRNAQRELLAEQKDAGETIVLETENRKLLIQVKEATTNRNLSIINIIKNMQELKHRETEIPKKQQEKEELLKTKSQMQQQFSESQLKTSAFNVAVVTPQSSSATRTCFSFNSAVHSDPAPAAFNFDSFNPFSFLRTLNAGMPKLPNFYDCVAELQTKKDAEGRASLSNSLSSISSVSRISADSETKVAIEDTTSLIRHSSSSSNREHLDLELPVAATATTKQVTFLLNSSMEIAADEPKHLIMNAYEINAAVVGEANFDSSSKYVADMQMETETQEIIVVSSQPQTQTNDLSTPETEEEIPSPEFEPLSGEKMNVKENADKASGSDKLVAVSGVKTSKLEVQECRIVKPAGTPLPKVLPTALTPTSPPQPSPPSSESNGTSSKGSDEPANKKPKASTSSFNDFLKYSVADSDSSAAAAKTQAFEKFLQSSLETRNESDGNDDNVNVGDQFDFDMNELPVGEGNTDEMFELDMSDSPNSNVPKQNTDNFL